MRVFANNTGESEGFRENTARELFFKTLSDLHFIKFSAVSSLGGIASRVVNTDCKLLVLQLGTVMNGQILRLKLVAALIANNSILLEPRSLFAESIIGYLKANDLEGSAARDAVILSRFLVVNCVEISSFKLLVKLAPVLKIKVIGQHLKVCLTEARAEKTILETKLSTFI